jgi:predicted metal-dependent phosphoesterase TrpH
VIDLHLHTTASDGRSTPEELVDEAVAAGLTTIAVTDHDTLAGVDAVAEAGAHRGLTVVPGVEITAVSGGRDVHILGYFFDRSRKEIEHFLARQREDRRRRFLAILDAIERLGLAIGQDQLRRRADDEPGRALGRPIVADALVRAGIVESRSAAFERYLAEGRPAFVPRRGAHPDEVVDLVKRAGGISSIAHPGKLHDDSIVSGLIDAGIPAIEVRHPDHDAGTERHYRRLAAEAGLLVTGGSDYHGPGSGRAAGLGRITVSADEFARLAAAAGQGGADG